MKKTAYPIKEFFSKGAHLASPWDNLSIREKAEMMKVAVRNGITDLPTIKSKYNEFAEGGEIESPVENSNIYAGGSYLDIAKQHIKKNEDWLAKPYRDAPKGKNWRSVGYGFNDSGFRSKYPQGISKHYENGITEAQAEEELNWFLGGVVNHLKKVYGKKWDSFNDNQKAAVIDTYYQRPASVVGKGSRFYKAVMAGDKNAGNYLGVAGYGNRNKDRRKLFGASQIESVVPTQEVLPISEPIQSMPEDTVDFIPWNPQAFFGVNNNTPIIIQQEAPVVEEKMPTPEEIERQERQQGLANFQTIMGMLNNTSDSTSTTMTPFESTVSMLTQQSPIHYFSDGGSISIKPENRGKFTRLKERTGHPEGDNNGPKFKESQEAYYDKDTDTIYAPDSTGEFYHHEMFHARPNSIELERLKPYYENLDDNRLLELGADLPFIKRIDNDPGHFYSPEEVGARVSAAKYMLNNAGINKVDNIFLEEARKNENAYGNNFRDLLHMYNDDNLIGIFNNSYSSGGKIYIKPSHRGRFTALKERTGHSASWFKENGTPAQKKMATFALNSRHWKHGDGGDMHIYNGGELPETTVTAYAPLRLTTHYPITSEYYPYTGHSELDIPIDRKTWYDYTGDTISSDRLSPYLTIDKTSSAKDYNLVTNNCADATLKYLNAAFGTSEKPWLFTTPGDVRDYALKKLNGKLIKNLDGSDTVLIPRNAKIAAKLSKTALNMFGSDKETAYISLLGPFHRHGLGGNLFEIGGPKGNNLWPKNIFNSLKRYVDRVKNNARSAAMRASYVDTRSDTTRKGYHEGRIRYGYNYGANENGITGTIARVIDGKDYNPYLQTGIAPMPDKIASPKDISRIRSVFKNLSKITPKQWTALQDAAIARGNMTEALRLRDLHFDIKAENNKAVYDGSIIKSGEEVSGINSPDFYHNTDAIFNSFDVNRTGQNWKQSTRGGKNGVYLSAHYPKSYYGKNKMRLRVYSENPQIMKEIPKEDAFSVKKGTDVVWEDLGMGYGPEGEVFVLDPRKIKSADAVTYDDNGIRIPLGDRDNFNINDIRWSWLLPIFGVGAGAAAADSTKALGGNLFEIGGPKNSKKKGEPEYMFDSTRYTYPNDTAGLLAEQVVTLNGNYPVLNPKGGEAWTIEALNDLGVPLYTKTSIPKQKDVELQHLEDKAKADEFVNKTIGNGEAFTPWGFFGLLFNEGMGAVASALPESVQEVLAKGRYISPSYWIDRGTGLSDEQLMSGEGKLFGTGTGTMFDILSTKGIGKGANVAATEAANTFSKIRQLSRLEKNYTGVPHKELREAPGTYMDEVFPNNHTQHTIWSTDDIDYPRSFDGPDRTIYDVYADPKELSILETPSIPEDKALYWQGLPYKLENGKVSFADNLSLERVGIPRSKDISLKKGGIGGDYTPDEVVSYIMKDGENGLIQNWKEAPGTISTDDVVKYSQDNGYGATRFNRVFDGASEINGTLYDYPINELVLNPNVPRYVLPHGASKLRLWNQLPTRYSQSNYFASKLPYTTLFRNYINNE